MCLAYNLISLKPEIKMDDGKTLFRALTKKKETSAQDYAPIVALPTRKEDNQVLSKKSVEEGLKTEESEKSYDPSNPPLKKMANLASKRAKRRQVSDEFGYLQDFSKINEELSYTAKVDQCFLAASRTTEANIRHIRDEIRKNPDKFDEAEFRNVDSYVKENIANKEKAARTKELLNQHKIDYY